LSVDRHFGLPSVKEAVGQTHICTRPTGSAPLSHTEGNPARHYPVSSEAATQLRGRASRNGRTLPRLARAIANAAWGDRHADGGVRARLDQRSETRPDGHTGKGETEIFEKAYGRTTRRGSSTILEEEHTEQTTPVAQNKSPRQCQGDSHGKKNERHNDAGLPPPAGGACDQKRKPVQHSPDSRNEDPLEIEAMTKGATRTVEGRRDFHLRIPPSRRVAKDWLRPRKNALREGRLGGLRKQGGDPTARSSREICFSQEETAACQIHPHEATQECFFDEKRH